MAKPEKADKSAKDAKSETVTEAQDTPETPTAPTTEPVAPAADTLSAMARSTVSKGPLRDGAAEPNVGLKVRAKETGFYNGARRVPGTRSEEFRLKPGDKVAKWMEELKK